MKYTLKNSNAYILAGGSSRRFGDDKALYSYQGKPLISYPADSLSNSFNQLSIIAKDTTAYSNLEYVVLEDLLSYQTPLAGIYTGLSHTDTDWNFFLGCDMPLMTIEVIEKLASCIPSAPADLEIIVPKTENGLQPLAAFYHQSLAAIFIEIAQKVYSIKDFIRNRHARIIEFESDKPFTNVNTKEELQNID